MHLIPEFFGSLNFPWTPYLWTQSSGCQAHQSSVIFSDLERKQEAGFPHSMNFKFLRYNPFPPKISLSSFLWSLFRDFFFFFWRLHVDAGHIQVTHFRSSQESLHIRELCDFPSSVLRLHYLISFVSTNIQMKSGSQEITASIGNQFTNQPTKSCSLKLKNVE